MRLLPEGCKYGAKGILQISSDTRKAIVEDPLILFERRSIEGLHHPKVEGKCFVPDDEKWHLTVIGRQKFKFGVADGVGNERVSQNHFVPPLGIRCCLWGTKLGPHDL